LQQAKCAVAAKLNQLALQQRDLAGARSFYFPYREQQIIGHIPFEESLAFGLCWCFIWRTKFKGEKPKTKASSKMITIRCRFLLQI
jgi:hypothetical protein